MTRDFTFEYSSGLINWKGFDIVSYVIGTGENVVLSLPSFPHSGLTYLWFLNHYRLDRVKFITLDFPGWIGYSDDEFKNKPFDIEDYVDIGREIIKHYKIDRFSVLGYSFGGSLAVRLVSEYRERVDKVVLVSGVFNLANVPRTKEMVAVNILKKLRLKNIVKLYLNWAWQGYKANLIKEGFPQSYMTLYSGMVAQADPQALLDSLYQILHLDWSKYLDALEGKKLLIVNSRDEIRLYRQQAELLRRKFPEGKSIYVHGDHEDFLLKPKSEVVKEVVKFLES